MYLLTVMIVEIHFSSHFCACPMPGDRFQTSFLFFFIDTRRKMIVHFGDISGIDDHRSINFLFRMLIVERHIIRFLKIVGPRL